MPADSCIHSAERIVQEVDVCVLIQGSRKRRETSGEDTTHSLGPISEFKTASNNSKFIPGAQGKGQDPASNRPTQWAGSVCLCPLGSVEEEGKDGNWNPIYLARLTRAFCPSLSGVPLSPISVRSPSSKSCKSYTDRKGEKEKDINCVLLPSYTFSISSSYKNLINVHTCSAAKSYSTLCNPMD